MTYVYDLVLNFNNELYDFYEWKKDDEIYHIKRINLVKISSESYNEILDYKVIFDDEFLLSIFNRCEYFANREVNKIPYGILLSDGYRVMALILDMHGNILKYSTLLLDEEEDILDITERLQEVRLKYVKKNKKKITSFKTRQENNIIKYIKKDLNISYKEKNISKLKYLYYEFFNRENDNIDEIYEHLIHSLDSEITEKHLNLYNLIKLSYTRKSV